MINKQAECLNCERELDLDNLYHNFCPGCGMELGIRRGFWRIQQDE